MTVREQVIEMRRGGMAPADICRKLGATRGQVSGYLFRAGLTDPSSAKSYRVGRPRTEEAFRRAVAETKGSQVNVAADWGVCQRSVAAWREEFGIPNTGRDLKLSEAQIAEIRAVPLSVYGSGVRLARRFKVSPGYVSRIRNGFARLAPKEA